MDEAMKAPSHDVSNDDDKNVHKQRKKQRIIRNPYQKKPSLLPPISNKPLYGVSASLDAHDPTNSSSHAAVVPSLKAPPTTTMTTAATAPPLPDAKNHHHALDNNDNGNQQQQQPNDTSTYQGAVSISLPPWQRLPSRNLSFGSAEILSITECVRHAGTLYQGRSIRCTGVLEQVVAGQESIAFHHPILSSVSPPPFLAVRLSDPLHRLGAAAAHVDDNNHTKKHNETAVSVPSPQLWVVFPTADATAAIHATPVGSAVTVLGEPMSLTRRGEWGLRARLSLTVAPTANLALEWQALVLRRRYLLSNTVSKQQAQNNVLQAGCGPPPYS